MRHRWKEIKKKKTLYHPLKFHEQGRGRKERAAKARVKLDSSAARRMKIESTKRISIRALSLSLSRRGA